MYRSVVLSLLCLPALACTGIAAEESQQHTLDVQVLKAVQLGVDGPALLDFFKKRTVTDTDRTEIDELIKQLGDEDFDKREKAKESLIDRGPVAMKQLKEALQSPDKEVAHRAEECLKLLTRAADPAVAAAAVRLLARKHPDGTVEALLAYLPFASDPMVVNEVREALVDRAVHEGKAEKAVVAALEDKSPLRRAAAAAALVRASAPDGRAELKKFLDDKDNTVRLWAAYAFLQAREGAAVPTLIDLLGSVDREEAYSIEDALCRVAGEKTPNVPVGKDEAGRKKCVDAWQKWWDEDGKKVDISKLDLEHRMLGYTLLVGMELNKGKGLNGKVQEIGPDGTLRWEIAGLRYAIDAHVIGHDRVLIVEYTGRTVTERNFQGEVLWRKDLQAQQLPLNAQRFSNGNTFIACRNCLLEVDKDGNEVFNIPRNRGDVFGAQKLRNGQILVVTNTGAVQVIDGEGKELNSMSPGMQAMFGGGFDVLPNGRILLPLQSKGIVAEFDAEGKIAWQAEAQQPSCVNRLMNQHTLVVNAGNMEVIELDQDGKEVWKHKSDSMRLLKARRR
jgi:hypothetical protein